MTSAAMGSMGAVPLASRVRKTKRRIWTMLAAAVLVQMLLLGLAIALLDLFAHDLLCRYGGSRWEPVERGCFLPTAEASRP